MFLGPTGLTTFTERDFVQGAYSGKSTVRGIDIEISDIDFVGVFWSWLDNFLLVLVLLDYTTACAARHEYVSHGSGLRSLVVQKFFSRFIIIENQYNQKKMIELQKKMSNLLSGK